MFEDIDRINRRIKRMEAAMATMNGAGEEILIRSWMLDTLTVYLIDNFTNGGEDMGMNDEYEDDWMYRASGGAVTSDEFYQSKFSPEEWAEITGKKVMQDQDEDLDIPEWDEVPF